MLNAVHNQARRALPLLFASAALAGCGGEPDHTPRNMTLNVEFAAKAGEAEAGCGAPIEKVGVFEVPVRLRDLRFYISDIRAVNTRNQEVRAKILDGTSTREGAVLIDLEDGRGDCAAAGDPRLKREVQIVLPHDVYRGLHFTVGLSDAENHSDIEGAKPPLDVRAMYGARQTGRSFMQVEVLADNADPFPVHLVAGDCSGDPDHGGVSCARSNRLKLSFPDFDYTLNRMVVDVAALLAGIDVCSNFGGPAGCTSDSTDPECGAVFDHLKLNLATGGPVDLHRGQTVFRVEGR